MKRVHVAILAVAAIVVAFVVGGAAATKTYQFTGTVKSIEGTQLTVEKSAKETWTFDAPADVKGGVPKVGGKVTVYYKMVATEIENKPATAAPAKTAGKKK